jgi:hypothetical protein
MPKSIAKNTKQGKGSGARRKHRGKMVLPSGSPRSHHSQGTIKASAGYSVDDTHDKNFGTSGTRTSNPMLGRYKVAMPVGRTHYVRPTI